MGLVCGHRLPVRAEVVGALVVVVVGALVVVVVMGVAVVVAVQIGFMRWQLQWQYEAPREMPLSVHLWSSSGFGLQFVWKLQGAPQLCLSGV